MTKLDTGIYKIENLRNGRIYIGSAVSIKKRWREHDRQLEAGIHHSRFMQRCYSKHGKDVFRFSVLLYCDRENLINYEKRAIDTFKPEYNSSPTAGSQLGYTHTAETRKKMSASRPKDFSPMTGKKHTEETKKKISESRKGKGGGPMSQERRDKIGAAHKGRIITAEMREKISNTLRGHKQSQEQISKRIASMPENHYEKVAISKSKLSEDQVRLARILVKSGRSRASVAREMSVSTNVIARMIRGLSYGWVS